MNDRIRELATEILRFRGEPAREDEHFASLLFVIFSSRKCNEQRKLRSRLPKR